METRVAIVTTVQMLCGECGIVFFVPDWFQRERLANGKDWYCPNGHCRIYKESEVARLKRTIQEKERETQTLKADLYRERDSREQADKKNERLWKKLRRVENGVCPECKRSFQDVQAHMKTQHPKGVSLHRKSR